MMIRHLPLTHPFQVSYARPAGDEAVETNLYVSNLPKTVTEELLDVIFGKYGTIIQKNILRDKLTGQPRGVAFIRYVLCIASLALCLPPPDCLPASGASHTLQFIAPRGCLLWGVLSLVQGRIYMYRVLLDNVFSFFINSDRPKPN